MIIMEAIKILKVDSIYRNKNWLFAVGMALGGTSLLFALKRNKARLKSKNEPTHAIFHGRIHHNRFHPTKHSFNYPTFFCFLDLEDLETSNDCCFWPLFSVEYPAFSRFRKKDHLKHLAGNATKLSEAIRELILEKTGRRPTGKICLLTHLSYFGYCFNPISVYYVYNDEGTQVQTIVGEVSNTPWLEMFCYVLSPQNSEVQCLEHSSDKMTYKFSKSFHVSPFMDMDHVYFWRFGHPSDKLWVKMGMIKQNETWFEAHLDMKRHPFNASTLLMHLARFPFYCITVQVQIHYQALCLWLKKVPFYSHPEAKETAASKAIAFIMKPFF